jgi:hypothetical protein
MKYLRYLREKKNFPLITQIYAEIKTIKINSGQASGIFWRYHRI